MRIRTVAISSGILAFMLVAAMVGSTGFARAQQDGTPAAGTPTAGAATPTALPPGAGVVTLVAWYQQDPSGDFLTVGPLRTNSGLVAGPGEPEERQVTGKVDLDSPDNGELPRITLGENILDGYAVYSGDPNTVLRWIFYNDDPGLRPATLVIQVTGTEGPYKGYDGTATFVSRAPNAGGVLIIVLNPPSS